MLLMVIVACQTKILRSTTVPFLGLRTLKTLLWRHWSFLLIAVFGWTKVSQLAPSKFTVVPEPPLIFGKFLQSSAGTTYMNIWRQRMKWCSVANWEPFQGVLATNLLKNRVVPALLFSLPLRATLQVLAIFGSRKPLWSGSQEPPVRSKKSLVTNYHLVTKSKN